MISSESYRADPCAVLSIPYWKNKNITLPNNMKIVHDTKFSAAYLEEYTDEIYFRLYHALENIPEIVLEDYEIVTATQNDMMAFVDIINRSYTDLAVTYEQLEEYTKTEVYAPELWIGVRDTKTGKFVGCGIADYDREMKELILEWIQVVPQYRGLKIGQLIVCELLARKKDIAEFATVSGKVDNITDPEKLYRKCGFTGSDVWHILRKRS